MKVEKATIEFEDGETQIVEFEGGTVIELAHALIELAQPQLDIKVTDERRQRFRDEAKKSFIKYKGNLDFDSFVALSEEKDVEKFFAVERCNHAYSEVVMAYEKKIKSLFPMKKKVFHFDYVHHVDNVFGNLKTESIEAWDEEHATLLFEKMHPGKSYDKPY